MDVVVKGRCYTNGRLSEKCIGVIDGRIAAISGELDGERIYNYGNKLILPSAIDSHVHMREPGATHKEDFSTGSLAALNGGVTCVLDRPNTNPPATTISALREKSRTAASKSLVDFGLFAGVVRGSDVGDGHVPQCWKLDDFHRTVCSYVGDRLGISVSQIAVGDLQQAAADCTSVEGYLEGGSTTIK